MKSVRDNISQAIVNQLKSTTSKSNKSFVGNLIKDRVNRKSKR